MIELKPLSKQAVPRALEKAERYRLLNEPGEAESICLDVLTVEPDNPQALVSLLLARTDQFQAGVEGVLQAAREALGRLRGEYERAYYAGIICERRAKALLATGAPGAHFAAYDLLREAMACYEKAEGLRPPGNDDALLRWNACARALNGNRNLRPRPEERFEPQFE